MESVLEDMIVDVHDDCIDQGSFTSQHSHVEVNAAAEDMLDMGIKDLLADVIRESKIEARGHTQVPNVHRSSTFRVKGGPTDSRKSLQ